MQRLEISDEDTEGFSSYDFVCIVFVDVVGFTRSVEENGDSRIAVIVRGFFELINQLVKERYEDVVLPMNTIGDAYMLVAGINDSQKCLLDASVVQTTYCFIVDVAGAVVPEMNARPSVRAAFPGGFSVRIGAEAGRAVVGKMTSSVDKLDCVSSSANYASRITARGPPGSIQIGPKFYGLMDERQRAPYHEYTLHNIEGYNTPIIVFSTSTADEWAYRHREIQKTHASRIPGAFVGRPSPFKTLRES